uniref:Uncharacterized protein n=1 Tax=Rhizophora mucronata TaxID=61149 RepID=A0A2P2KU37_RHIMU
MLTDSNISLIIGKCFRVWETRAKVAFLFLTEGL